MGAGLGQSLNCLKSSHSGSRCSTTTVPGHDFSGSMLVDLWKQQLRDTKANRWHSKVEMRPTDGANNGVPCVLAQRVTGDTAEHTRWWTALAEKHSGSSPSGSALFASAWHYSSEKIWGLPLQQLGNRSRPWQGTGNHRAKRRTHSITRAGSDHHNPSHTSYKGIMSSIHREKNWQASTLKQSSHQKILNPHRLGLHRILPHKNSPLGPQ